MVESINKTFILKKKIVNSKQKIVNQNVLKYNIEKQFQKTKERKKKYMYHMANVSDWPCA